MGDYFKKAKDTVKDEGPQLIMDYDRLLSSYTELLHRIEETIRGSADIMMPILEELMGTGETIDDLGQIDLLRQKIKNSGVRQMSIGPLMINAVKNMENYCRWNLEFQQRVEKHVDGLKIISQSSFKIINELREQLVAAQEKITELTATPDDDAEPVYYPLSNQEKQEFATYIMPYIEAYKQSALSGETGSKLAIHKARIFRYSSAHPEKREISTMLFDRAVAEIDRIAPEKPTEQVTETETDKEQDAPMTETVPEAEQEQVLPVEEPNVEKEDE